MALAREIDMRRLLFSLIFVWSYCATPCGWMRTLFDSECKISNLISQSLFQMPATPAHSPKTSRNAPEHFLIRVENAQYGPVEVSLDGGRSYLLIGRTLRRADQTLSAGSELTSESVIKQGKYGILFSTGRKKLLKIVPASRERNPPFIPGTIFTNIEVGTGLFGKFGPQKGSPALLQRIHRSPSPFTENYSAHRNDHYLFEVSPSPPSDVKESESDWDMQFKQAYRRMAASYAAGAVMRAFRERRTVVTGTLTLKAILPENEPDPITYVLYKVDKSTIEIQNRPPYSFPWDTTAVTDGEHVVEITAVDSKSHVVTRARALIVVQNHKNAKNKSLPEVTKP